MIYDDARLMQEKVQHFVLGLFFSLTSADAAPCAFPPVYDWVGPI